MGLHVVEIGKKDLFDGFIRKHHRHHPPPVGYIRAIGVITDCPEPGERPLVGVGCIGRTVSRVLHLRRWKEVTRTCVNPEHSARLGANLKLYVELTRAARSLGFPHLVSYSQAGESGATFRALEPHGWVCEAELRASSGWSRANRPRPDNGTDNVVRIRWGVQLAGEAAAAWDPQEELADLSEDDGQSSLFEEPAQPHPEQVGGVAA